MNEALIVVDMQNEFLDPAGSFSKKHAPIDVLIGNCILAVKQARERNHLVVWVKSHYLNNSPALNESPEPWKKRLIEATHTGKTLCCVEGTFNAEFHPRIQEQIAPHDFVLIKQFYSAFKETTLEKVLKENNVTNITVIGVVTNVCVYATCVSAKNLGFEVTMLEDCTSSSTEKKHIEALGDLLENGIRIAKLN
eukprot:TRINITY_DN6503_c0_g1_i3.p1 TRINITY_DN6503_c0_g1~~TRINITY_DN6503_c0_g1_i3.p1  ORF type:complete len:194 (-),score=43.87 TRINITY_DN6503_c0_g1_i3:37-618(-)